MGAAALGGIMLIVTAVIFLIFVKPPPPPRRPDRIIEEYDIKKWQEALDAQSSASCLLCSIVAGAGMIRYSEERRLRS